MRLDPSHFCYLTNTEFRVLTAIEIGMRNHQYIPLSLITTTANLRSVGMSNVIASLLKAKLIVHSGKVYDGYKLTFLGLDYLALRALSKRGVIAAVGRRIGVGKEADVHLCKDTCDNLVVLKFHRLGRISFRSVKNNRDYMGSRKHASWMYLSQLAAKKEFSYLSSLHEEAFPVPEPLDYNRHVIAMRFVDGVPLSQVREMGNPARVLEVLMGLIVRLARLGVIHGDFNEFNLMISEDGAEVTVIDFPQVISVFHPDAQFYFERDVRSVVELYKRKFKIDVVDFPRCGPLTRRFHDVVRTVDPARAERLKVDISAVENEFLNEVFQSLRQEAPETGGVRPGGPDDVAEDMGELALQEYYELGRLSSDHEDPHASDAPCSDSRSNLSDNEATDHSDEADSYEHAPSGSDAPSTDLEDSDMAELEHLDNGEPRGHIQLWKPHVKRVGRKAYGRRLHARSRNKAKAESKKDHKQRKVKESVNIVKDLW